MFNGSIPEKCDGPIDLPDIHPGAFENMLRYIYMDARNETARNAFPTMVCADKYDLSILVDRCFNCIFTHLTVKIGDANRYIMLLEDRR
ncbi:BTB/POZ domain-containing protein 3-like [Paramacrobiotus metropolitanus]|uniref:BTB/POZ domain-containing protein 3-like n=1 Tax=Paramacrobiotus metropolitanus TaxID=2943436 RepID=UPI002446476F|nr:BTB/POZ domain-containing protein 3-like [Paramacrobiotus metropolitanus]